MNDPIHILDDILRRNGHDADLRENENDRYFLFDRIANPQDLDLAWSQFPAHREVRARAEEVDAVSDIVDGFGYRIPKKTNHCSDATLMELVREHLTATRPFLTDSWDDIGEFINEGFDIEMVDSEVEGPEDTMNNDLFMASYESMGDFKIEHYSFELPLLKVLYDWATYLTKCDEVALYLLWPVLKGLEGIDPETPNVGFRLWQYGCRTSYWIKDSNLKSRVVCIQRP